MTSIEEADAWIGQTAIDDTGEQIGLVSQIWVDDVSGRPEWASVSVAVLGMGEVLVPLAGTMALGSGRQFAFTKEEIVDAPRVAQDGTLGREEIEQLTAYYGTPAADVAPPAREASWADRMEAQIRGGRPAQPIPPREADAEDGPRKASRFGRKPARAAQPKAGRRFGRKAASTGRPPASVPLEPDEIPISG